MDVVINWFQTGNTPTLVLRIVFVVLMTGISAVTAWSFVKYLRDYKILQMLVASIRGKTEEFDRIRREQMKEAFKSSSDIMVGKAGKPTVLQRIYRQISMSGLPGKIPGFRESSFLTVILVVDLFVIVSFAYRGAFVQGVVLSASFTAIVFYLLSILSYKRAIQVESQMLDFVNLVASTSRQYSSLIDIFGIIYEHFKNPLRAALEETYVEAKKTNNMEQAFAHLKEKFDSPQFEFVIDNLMLCSVKNGQYFDVAIDLSKIEKVYYNSFQKKRQLLNHAKMLLVVMFGFAVCIIVGMGQFTGGGWREIVLSDTGIVLSSIMVLLLVYSMNMKAR